MSLTINRATTTVPLCLNLSLKADHDRATANLEDVRKRNAADPREASTDLADAAAVVQALEQEMLDATITFTLTAMQRKKWAEWELSHPAREGNDTDAALGVDTSALDGPLAACITSVTNPAGEVVPFDAASEWEALSEEMSPAQYTQFALALLRVNNGQVAAPFSQAASRVIQRSAATSKPLSD